VAEIEKFMNVALDDIEKIMNIAKGDIEKVMGLELPASVPAWQGPKGMSLGRQDSSNAKTAEVSYRTIATGGSNTSDAGNLINVIINATAVSNNTYGVTANGVGSSGNADWSERVTIASNGTGMYFNSSAGRANGGGSAGGSNGTTGFMSCGGYAGGVVVTTEYITIGTSGSFASGGNLTAGRVSVSGVSNANWCYIAGGYNGSNRVNTIDRLQFTSPTTIASDVGDLAVAINSHGASEDGSRGVILGGYDGDKTDTIQYFATASGEDASDFGNCQGPLEYTDGCSNGTIAEMWGGDYHNDAFGHANWENIYYITIASTGNATDTGATVAAWDEADAHEASWGTTETTRRGHAFASISGAA